MPNTIANVNWLRVLLASVAAHVASVAVTVVLILLDTFLVIVVPQGAPEAGSAHISVWALPALTLLAAAWAARGASAGVLPGSLVGVLVAGVFGLVYYWPFDPISLMLLALIISAGFVGGLIGRLGRG